MTVLTPDAARRVFLTLTLTRWFPVGLVVGVFTLLPLQRGLSVSQALTATAATGFVVFALELPTSSFADVFGRKPVYVAAAIVNIAAAIAYFYAHSFWAFVLAACLMGMFRALDSGPLEAWYVDTVHVTLPGADVDQTLAKGGTMLGVGISTGALLSAALVAWDPVERWGALTLPVAVLVGLNVVHLLAVLLLLKEDFGDTDARAVRRAIDSAKQAPQVVREGLGLIGTNPVLRGLIFVEVAWSIAMIVFETFQPIRLAELLGSEAEAGAWQGVVAAVGWAIFGVGSALSGQMSKRIGVAKTAILMRLLNGFGAILMGLMFGPLALVAAYMFTYAMHGGGGPVHATLLHREASAHNRATVLSMTSMAMFMSYSLAAPLLGVLADRTSNQLAMVLAGAISLIGAWFYLPALRREDARTPATMEA